MKSIIYLDRNSLSYFGGNTHTVLSFPLTPKTIKDAEIIDRLEFNKTFSEWLKSNKIEPNPTTIILSPAYYFKKLVPPKTSSFDEKNLVAQFSASVPFEKPETKTFLISSSTIIIATNKQILDLIRDSLTAENFLIDSILPLILLVPSESIVFNIESAKNLLGKAPTLRAMSFLIENQPVIVNSDFQESLPQEKTNSRLIVLLLLLFVGLLLVGVLLYRRSRPVRLPANKVTNNPTQTQPSPTLTPALSPSITPKTSKVIPKDELTIKIFNGSGIPGQADTIGKQLIEAGFKKIETGNAENTSVEKTTIIFGVEVDPEIRNAINEIISKFDSETVVLEKTDIDYDVIITTSASSKGTVQKEKLQ